MSSPDALCYEFSRSLEQCFAWSPPDLSVSSKSSSSIVALSPSEIAQLGLSRFDSEPAPSNLFLALQTASSREIERETGEAPSTRNNIRSLCATSSSGRIDEHRYTTRPPEPGIRRHSIYQAMTFNTSGNPQCNLASQHLPSSTGNNLFSRSSSSILFSSTSREFSSQSSSVLCGDRVRIEDGYEQNDAPYRQVSSGDNRTIRHRLRSYPGLANDDVPSALDFHINTFPPSLVLGPPTPVARPEDNHMCIFRSYPSDIQLLPSSSTFGSFSPLPTLSDGTDVHRQLIHFPSPTFSLSRFPSSLSSPAIGSSEISGDTTAAFPSNWDAEDIIVDMIPISDECGDGASAYEITNTRCVHACEGKEGLAVKFAKWGGKFKRALLNRIRSLRAQNMRNGNHNTHFHSSDNDGSAPWPPPGLIKHIHNDMAVPLERNSQKLTVQETSDSQIYPLPERFSEVESNPPKSMRKRFSLSFFGRPSAATILNDPGNRKQTRPKSMPDLSNQYPTGSTLVESCHSNNQTPQSQRNKEQKKQSLLFLRSRS